MPGVAEALQKDGWTRTPPKFAQKEEPKDKAKKSKK
jgi:hypothetical protein